MTNNLQGDQRVTESKHERFQRLAKKRAEKVAEELRKIGNLSSPNYQSEPEEVEKLFEYLQDRLNECRDRFRSIRRVKSLDF